MKAHFLYSLDFWLLFSNGKVIKRELGNCAIISPVITIASSGLSLREHNKTTKLLWPVRGQTTD
jgi:hypothetical protein